MEPTPDLNSPAAMAAALRTYQRIADAWGLDTAERNHLLGLDALALQWACEGGGAGLAPDGMMRLSHVFAIYGALHSLLPVPEHANAWMRRANSAPLMQGCTALEFVLDDPATALPALRQYLNAQL